MSESNDGHKFYATCFTRLSAPDGQSVGSLKIREIKPTDTIQSVFQWKKYLDVPYVVVGDLRIITEDKDARK